MIQDRLDKDAQFGPDWPDRPVRMNPLGNLWLLACRLINRLERHDQLAIAICSRPPEECPRSRTTCFDHQFCCYSYHVHGNSSRTPSLVNRKAQPCEQGFTHVLYDLAVHPEYVEPLREEVKSVIDSDGWSKVAMNKLRKLDSFIRESQRMAGTGAGMLRL